MVAPVRQRQGRCLWACCPDEGHEEESEHKTKNTLTTMMKMANPMMMLRVMAMITLIHRKRRCIGRTG